MSFLKAEKLLSLASLTSARHRGVSIDDVRDRFGVSKRTAQRMLKALESQFPEAVTSIDDEGRKRWQLPRGALKDLLTITPEELTAFDLATELLVREGATTEAQNLITLREKLFALIPRVRARSLEVDHEALLEAHGFVARPGPRPFYSPVVSAALSEALKGFRIIEFTYGPDESRSSRRVAPYGILTGLRRYLVAAPVGASDGIKLFAIENIYSVEITADSFTRDNDFDLEKFAQKSFGVFQNEDEYGEVVLQFTPKAASRARTFVFHPTQILSDDPNGGLIVRFTAGGFLEMAWHLYIWGDQVEVLAPEKLRAMVHPHRRADFASLP